MDLSALAVVSMYYFCFFEVAVSYACSWYIMSTFGSFDCIQCCLIAGIVKQLLHCLSTQLRRDLSWTPGKPYGRLSMQALPAKMNIKASDH